MEVSARRGRCRAPCLTVTHRLLLVFMCTQGKEPGRVPGQPGQPGIAPRIMDMRRSWRADGPALRARPGPGGQPVRRPSGPPPRLRTVFTPLTVALAVA